MKPSELMRACGSKTGQWEAESIEQWRWMARNAEGKEQALAWIRLKSIANQSPWCVDAETGRRLTIANMAGALGWTLKTAQNVCYALAKEERIVTEGGRIRYRADVSEESVAESVKTDGNALVQGHFSLEVTDFIRKLPREKREVVDAFIAWRPKFLAEAAAAARSIVERVERTTLAQVGCKKKYLPKRREVQLPHLQLILTEAPDFVQGQLEGEPPLFVQTPENGSYKPENGFVHGDASLVCSDPDSDKTIGSSSSVSVLAARLQLDDDAAQNLWNAARKQEPTITVRELVHLGQSKLLQIGERTKNRVGLLLTAVPPMAKGATLATARAAAAEEVRLERQQAQAWLDADPRDYDTDELRAMLDQNRVKARAAIERLDSETGKPAIPKAKGQHS